MTGPSCRTALLACLAVLAGCAASEEAGRIIENTTAERTRQLDAVRAARRDGVIHEEHPWYGDVIPLSPSRDTERGRALPPDILARRYRISTGGPRGLGAVRATIERITGLPVRVRSTVPGPGGTVVSVSPGGSMTLDHDGPLPDLLDRVAARFDMAWHWDGASVRLDRFVTRTWRLAVPVQKAGLVSSVAVTTGAYQGSAEIDPWAALEAELAALVPEPARWSARRETGAVTVTAPPSVIAAVAPAIARIDRYYATRISLDIALLLVDAEAADDYSLGVDLNLAFGPGAFGLDIGNGTASANYALRDTPEERRRRALIRDRIDRVEGEIDKLQDDLDDPSNDQERRAEIRDGIDTLHSEIDGLLESLLSVGGSLTNLATGAASGLSILPRVSGAVNLRALSSDRRVVDSHYFTDVTQPGTVVPFVAGRERAYVSGRRVTQSGDSGLVTTEIETGKEDDGISMTVLARLLDAGRIHLTVTLNRNDIVRIASFGDSGSEVQLPEIDRRTVHKSVVLGTGETMVLAGYEKEEANRDDAGLGRPDIFGPGARRKGSVRRTRLIVLIRPTVLPPAAPGRARGRP